MENNRVDAILWQLGIHTMMGDIGQRFHMRGDSSTAGMCTALRVSIDNQ